MLGSGMTEHLPICRLSGERQCHHPLSSERFGTCPGQGIL